MIDILILRVHIAYFCAFIHKHDEITFLLTTDSCPQSKAPVFCPVSPCDYQNCYNYPEAICTTDVCGQCKAKFSINGTDVTESCGQYNCSHYLFTTL